MNAPIKMMIGSGAALIGLLLIAAPAPRSAAPVRAASGAPRVVPHGEMSVERGAHQATVLRTGAVLVTGGCRGHGCEEVLASAELYDPATRSFRPVAAMATPRASHAAAALPDGRVLVAGGWTGDHATGSAEVYDPATDRWMAAGEMTEARVSHVAVPLLDGRVLMMGGGEGRLGNLASAEVFDPATSTFSPVSPMGTNHYLATRLADGRVLVTGGQNAQGEILRSAEIFDPTTGEFQPTGNMAVPRVKHAAALLTDGRVLIIGGSDTRGYRARFTSTEVYDPATGKFSPGPQMRRGRHKLRDAVAVLPSGAIVVAGGAERPEIFDPVARVFVPVEGELNGPQMFATATLLHSGEVLVLGGYDDSIRPSASAWLTRTGERGAQILGDSDTELTPRVRQGATTGPR